MIILEYGLLYNTDQGSIGVVHMAGPTPDGQAARVHLGVTALDAEEHDYTLQAGDRFPLGEAIWAVQEIESAGTDDYVARIIRVDEAAQRRRDELRSKWSLSPEAWAQGQQRVREQEQRARESFGDRPPFAIPDQDTDA